MKCLKLILAISAFSMAQTVFALQPNNCNDGGVYRAMVGSEVQVDRNQNKSLTVNGQNLIDCKIGNTTSCVGTTYNNYTCNLNFAKVTGAAAQKIQANLDLGPDAGLILTRANADDTCGYMHCIVEDILTCANNSCEIAPVISGWDE